MAHRCVHTGRGVDFACFERGDLLSGQDDAGRPGRWQRDLVVGTAACQGGEGEADSESQAVHGWGVVKTSGLDKG